MELNDQPFAPTLAHKLGDVPHVSGLLRRLAQLSRAGERIAEWLLKVAVEFLSFPEFLQEEMKTGPHHTGRRSQAEAD